MTRQTAMKASAIFTEMRDIVEKRHESPLSLAHGAGAARQHVEVQFNGRGANGDAVVVKG